MLRPRLVLCGLCLLCCSAHSAVVSAANYAAGGPSGADVFLRYCAGCHGFDGFAEYPHAPSFSMGERLQKSDEELLRSVLSGKHAMPYWQDKLPVELYLRAIGYLRTMQQRYNTGLPPRQQPVPDMHYRFNPVGEDEDYWMYR